MHLFKINMFCVYCITTFPHVSDIDSIGKLSLFAQEQKQTNKKPTPPPMVSF